MCGVSCYVSVEYFKATYDTLKIVSVINLILCIIPICSTLCMQVNFACFLSSADFFQNQLFYKKILETNSLDPGKEQI